MGAVVGYGVALQASCLEGFDFLGLHQICGCDGMVYVSVLNIEFCGFESHHPHQNSWGFAKWEGIGF